MTSTSAVRNRVKELRQAAGLTQAELAKRAAISRTAVTAIEQGRLTTSVATALALARVLACRVEDLFGTAETAALPIDWAWGPPPTPCRYWHAEVGGRRWLYPVESTNVGEVGHDGIWTGTACREVDSGSLDDVLVIATCDPAVGLLAAEYARQTRFRLLPITRSSRVALELVANGKVHAAGVHLSPSRGGGGNAAVVRQSHGTGFRQLRIALWEEGIAFAPELRLRSPRSALRSRVRWVGREAGSGARQCQDELLEGRSPPRRLAPDHRSVALAIRCGWADAGVCLRLAGEEAGLGFLELRREAYDLCFREELETDRRMRALIDVVRSVRYRRLLDALPGYASRFTGDVSSC